MSKEIIQVSTDVLKVHPRNAEFFDDIQGKEYEQFKQSISQDGVLSPILVSPDMTIISGHQRLKACKELGIKLVPIMIIDVLINGNEIPSDIYDDIWYLISRKDDTNMDNCVSATEIKDVIEKSREIAKELEKVTHYLDVIIDDVNAINASIRDIKDEIFRLKYAEEITDEQERKIVIAAKEKVNNLLNNDTNEIDKYFKVLVQKLYADAHKYAGLGSKISCTKKGNYQVVMDYIDEWYPECGCAELKVEADARAEARRKARDAGYNV